MEGRGGKKRKGARGEGKVPYQHISTLSSEQYTFNAHYSVQIMLPAPAHHKLTTTGEH